MKILWRVSWLFIALSCGYLLLYSWQLELLTLTPVDSVGEVKKLIQEGKYLQADELVQYLLDIGDDPQYAQLQDIAAEIAGHRASLDYQVDQLFTEPLLHGTSEEVAGQGVALVSSFFIWGDIRDLSHQALRYLHDDPLDQWIVTLSVLSMAASAAQVVSLGTSTPTKISLAFLSLAHKTGVLTAKFRQYFLVLGQKALDGRSLQPVIPTLRRLKTVFTQAGLSPSLKLMSSVQGPGDLNRMVHLTQHFGPATGPLVQVSGPVALSVALKVDHLGGPELVKTASRFGAHGLGTLEKVGALRFIKYGSRMAKMAYQYHWLSLMAKVLLSIPQWVLYSGIAFGLLFGIPWPWHKLLTDESEVTLK